MPVRKHEISARDFRRAVEALGYSVYASTDLLGISLRQAQRYAGGETPVPETVSKLLDMLMRHGVPRAWTQDQ